MPFTTCSGCNVSRPVASASARYVFAVERFDRLEEQLAGHTVALLILGLIVLAVIIAAYGLLTRLWSRYGLGELRYERHLSTRRALVGDAVDLTLQLRIAPAEVFADDGAARICQGPIVSREARSIGCLSHC